MVETFPGPAYLICCDARTGSGVLAESLRIIQRAGKPFEYFSQPEIDKPWLRAELGVPDDVPFTGFPNWRSYIVKSGASGGGIFAATVHFYQFEDCANTFRVRETDRSASALEVLRQYFPDLRLVRLTRANVVAQAISHYVAIAADVWNSRQADERQAGEVDRRAPYDFEKIDWQVQSALAASQGWRAALAGAEPITLQISYEELAADLPSVVGRVLGHVGIDPSLVAIPPPELRKQAGARSREMEARYRDERRARGLGPIGDEAAL